MIMASDRGHVSLANRIVLMMIVASLLLSFILFLFVSRKYAYGVILGVAIAVMNIYLTAAFVSFLGKLATTLSSAKGSSLSLGGSILTAICYFMRFMILIASLYLVVKIPGVDVLSALISLVLAHTFFCAASVGFSINGISGLFNEEAK